MAGNTRRFMFSITVVILLIYVPGGNLKSTGAFTSETAYTTGTTATTTTTPILPEITQTESQSNTQVTQTKVPPIVTTKLPGPHGLDRTDKIILGVTCSVMGLLLIGGIAYACKTKFTKSKEKDELHNKYLERDELHSVPTGRHSFSGPNAFSSGPTPFSAPMDGRLELYTSEIGGKTNAAFVSSEQL